MKFALSAILLMMSLQVSAQAQTQDQTQDQTIDQQQAADLAAAALVLKDPAQPVPCFLQTSQDGKTVETYIGLVRFQNDEVYFPGQTKPLDEHQYAVSYTQMLGSNTISLTVSHVSFPDHQYHVDSTNVYLCR